MGSSIPNIWRDLRLIEDPDIRENRWLAGASVYRPNMSEAQKAFDVLAATFLNPLNLDLFSRARLEL